MTDLHLPLKREYFEQIRDGVKTEEYRLCNEYWRKRLEWMEFDRIIRPWRGYTFKTIAHPHFGPDPVQVFSIDVRPE